MVYFRTIIVSLGLLSVFSGVLALLLSSIAPWVGLGSKEDFFFYQLANITRKECFFAGGIISGIGFTSLFFTLLTARDISWVRHTALRYLPIERIVTWSKERLTKLKAYYALPPRAPKYHFNIHDQIALLIASIAGVALFLFKPLIFECDAAMFYNYAKFLTFSEGGGFTFFRPPGFPAFLAATGQILFETFTGTIIAQAIMGGMLPILMYRILAPISRVAGICGALAFIISTIPFAAIKMMLATQLFIFLIVLSVYFYSRYYFSNDPRYILLTVITLLMAMFTRWEGSLALLVFIVFIAVTCRTKSIDRRLLGLSVILVCTVIASWNVTRAVAYKDPNLLFSLHGGTGQQFFWRIYQHMPGEIMELEKALGLKTKANAIGKSSNVSANITGQETTARPGIQLVSLTNGDSTKKLRNIVKEFAERNPESYRKLKTALDQAYRSPTQSERDYYLESFGRFEGHPDQLADNIFVNPNGFYPNYVFNALTQTLGISGADSLLKDVAWEALKAHWVISISWLRQALTFFGIDLQPVINAYAAQTAPNNSIAFVFWGASHYNSVVFDVGGCVTKNLPQKMAVQIKDSLEPDSSEKIKGFISKLNDLRNFVRNVIGPVAILSLWALFFSRHRRLYSPVLLSTFAFVGSYGILAGGVYTRYEFPVQPLLIIITMGSIHTIIQLIYKRDTQ